MRDYESRTKVHMQVFRVQQRPTLQFIYQTDEFGVIQILGQICTLRLRRRKRMANDDGITRVMGTFPIEIDSTPLVITITPRWDTDCQP